MRIEVISLIFYNLILRSNHCFIAQQIMAQILQIGDYVMKLLH